MVKNIKISIIIPIYNSQEYLKKCLDSVVNQTYKNTEIILINDGSIDKSLDICKNYQKKYSNIIIIDKKNEGQGKARNLGIKKSTGHYIMFVDSDDYVEEKMLEKMYSVSNNGEIDIVVCDMYKVQNKKNIYLQNLLYFSGNNNINLMLSNPGPTCKLIKKNILTKHKLYFIENKIYEDLGTIPLLGTVTKTIEYLSEPLYYYIIREDSTMKQKKYNKKLEDIFYIMEHLNKNLKKHKKELEYLYIEHLLYSATLRFLKYEGTEYQIKKINEIMKSKNWNKNEYFKKRGLKFKLVCYLSYYKKYNLLKKVSK